MTEQEERPKTTYNPGVIQSLREQAERKFQIEDHFSKNTPEIEETKRLVHELLVHQIELEIQNEELRKAQEDLQFSRERFEDLYNFSPTGYCTIDKKGLILEANLTLAKMLDVPQSVLPTQPLSNFILPEDQDICYHFRNDLVYTEKAQVCELRMRQTDSAPFWVRLEAAPIRNQNGTPAYQIVLSDISEKKRAEEEKELLSAQLQQAQKMEAIGLLAGGIAHDFNNILGAIIGYAQLIKEDSPPNSATAYDINQILKAGMRAKELVNQILACSRQTENHKIPMQPAPIVKDAVNMLRASLPTTITIKVNIDPKAGVILANPGKIHQIVMNLGINAFHAMEVKGGILSISLSKEEPQGPVRPGHFVQLSVRDTGVGIPPEIKHKIFDPYFTTKEIGKGTGLGLAIVYGIVQSCGGSITCNSWPDKGTEFRILLPIVEEQISPEIESSESTPIGNEHILLVDDEEMLLEMSTIMLERLGYRVTARSDSMEALSTFQNQPDIFDLVITDHTMPGITGFDLARRLLQIRPNLPIILCTGYSNQMTEQQVRSIGVKDFVLKPVSTKDLGQRIRKVLHKD